MDRVAFFIDGYNLYHGMMKEGMRPWLWVGLGALCRSLMPANTHLEQLNYYTAERVGDPGSIKRQDDWLAANHALTPELRVVKGFMQPKTRGCKAPNGGCGATWPDWVEKRTDVSIALDIVMMAQDNQYDVGIVLTGDADQVGPIRVARALNRTMIAAFPPQRQSWHLEQESNSTLIVSKQKLKKSQMVSTVGIGNGQSVERPNAVWGPRNAQDPGWGGHA